MRWAIEESGPRKKEAEKIQFEDVATGGQNVVLGNIHLVEK